MEDDLRWKMTFSGRHSLVEDTFSGRQTLVEDDLHWKTTFGGRQPSVEDDLRWTTAFGGRQLSVDPCMLPTSLCGIFLVRKLIFNELTFSHLSTGISVLPPLLFSKRMRSRLVASWGRVERRNVMVEMITTDMERKANSWKYKKKVF